MATIGERIKRYRKEKGFTQEQLANIIGVSVMTIRRFESGTREPKIFMLEKIAAALDIPTATLYGVSETPGGFLSFVTDMFSFDEENKELLTAFDMLNNTGKQVAVQRVQELTEIERYTKDEEP